MADQHPCPKEPEDFERRPMVDWLAPGQLARTGIKAVLSGVFGAYADKREVMAALNPENEIDFDYSGESELWFDYVADLGDGFDSTYTIARLLAAPRLSLRRGEKTFDTPRGRFLVMGGDQVYPTASFDEYRNRLLMPYKAALPCVPVGEPHLYAIPGNHDWYDGLSNFTRIFCQRGWIGGWKTKQRRSYFAVKLPHNWWLWGIDIQLEGFIDKPQLDFFYHHATHNVQANDRVILCTAEPSWVYGVTKGPEAFRSLAFFEDRTIRQVGKCEPRVTLTGDLHHYTRYESADGKVQRLTAGGGGAYLFATHHLPEELELEEGFDDTARKVKYKKAEATFPNAATSRALTFGAVRLPWRSWRFSIFLAAIYTLYAWIVQSVSKMRPDLPDGSFMQHLQNLPATAEGLGDALRTFGRLLAHSPECMVFSLLIVGGLIGFCGARSTAARIAIGTAHGLAHILLNVLLIWLFAKVNLGGMNLDLDSGPQVLAFVLEMLVLGGFLGGVLMAFYLTLFSFVGGFHLNEAYSSQRIADYKNFLRLHIDETGRLTIYPVGVARVCKTWKPQPGASNGQPWFEPDGETIEPELIEEPIVVS